MSDGIGGPLAPSPCAGVRLGRGMAHTNGVESFWSMLKRGYQGTFHHFREKHLDRYVGELAGRHNDRDTDAVDQMTNMAANMAGRRLRYSDLIQ